MFEIYVQNKFLKTPLGNLIQVPTLALARAIEEEWEKDPSPYYQQKPLTSLVATALDQVEEARTTYIAHVIQAVPKDVILFWASMPDSLVKLQEEKWAPLIEEVNLALGLSLKPNFSLSIASLSSEEENKVKEFLDRQTTFKLAGFVHLLTLTSSFCISFLVIQSCLSPEKAWSLAHLHEHDQRHTWGEDEEALILEKSQREEFLETIRFLKLIM